MTFRQII